MKEVESCLIWFLGQHEAESKVLMQHEFVHFGPRVAQNYLEEFDEASIAECFHYLTFKALAISFGFG